MDTQALAVTARLAAATTAILLVIALPLAWWLATTRRWWRLPAQAALSLPLVLPPTVLGFYVLYALGPESPVGKAAQKVWGAPLVFSFPGILIASVLFNLPFMVRPLEAAFASVDRRLLEASWCLGVSRLGTFRRVVLPLAWPGVLAGVVLTFAHTVGEFGVVYMVGANIEGSTRTLAIAIYDDVQSQDYAAAGRTSAVLLAFSFGVLMLTYGLLRRGPPQ